MCLGDQFKHGASVLKKLNSLNKASAIDEKNTIIISAVMDEQWSFVGAKKKPRSLFYAHDRVKRKVLCHVFGRRTKATLNRLLTLLKHASIYYFMTDAWQVYSSILPAEKHIIDKCWTQRIERYNLNLRRYIKRLNRKTICFSKLPEMHDKVIGWYLTIHHYQ